MSYVQTLKRVVPSALWPCLGRIRRRLRSIPARTQRQKQELASDNSLTESNRQLLTKVSSEIHHNDGMYQGDGRHYFLVGLSAIGCLDQALAAANLTDIKTALDMPCGYGRVLRFLVHRFPQTRFIACDLDRDGVNYCASTFGSEAAYSLPELDQLSLPSQFDLIWCGSLITHLDHTKIPALLRLFSRHLSRGGLVVFTAAGNRVVERMCNRAFDYGIAEEKIPLICADYEKSGHGYTDYPYMAGYGISLTSPDWIRGQVRHVGGLKELFFQPHAWDNHQDVYGFVRER
jgi:SAM-dependent methyltransferase